jgi:hypothetical protein
MRVKGWGSVNDMILKGLHRLASAWREGELATPHTPLFLAKSAKSIDSKRVRENILAKECVTY